MAFLEMIYLKAITLAAEKKFPCVYKGNTEITGTWENLS